jgi:hypothetical protein
MLRHPKIQLFARVLKNKSIIEKNEKNEKCRFVVKKNFGFKCTKVFVHLH